MSTHKICNCQGSGYKYNEIQQESITDVTQLLYSGTAQVVLEPDFEKSLVMEKSWVWTVGGGAGIPLPSGTLGKLPNSTFVESRWQIVLITPTLQPTGC